MSERPRARRTASLLGELLVKAQQITADELAAAEKVRAAVGGRIESVLVTEGYVDPRTLANFLAKLEKMTQINLGGFELDPELIALVPAETAVRHSVVPVDKMGSTLTLATTHPLDEGVCAAIGDKAGLTVKLLLCSEGDIKALLDRYYSGAAQVPVTTRLIEAPLKIATAVSMLSHIDGLPGLPGTVESIREMLQTDTGSGAEAAEVISRDPAVAAKVLKVSNSAAFGLARHVDNITLAVSLLGLLETYSVVVSTSVINMFDRSRTFDYMNFWLESMACATFASALSKSMDTRIRTGVFSAGLLHDIGRVALAEVAPNHYARVGRSLTGFDLVDDEHRKIGLSHAEAGHQLAQRWGLPEEIAQTIRFHHTPEHADEENRALVSMVNIADVMSRSHRSDAESREVDFTECRGSMQYLEVSEPDLLQIFQELPKMDEGDSLWSPN